MKEFLGLCQLKIFLSPDEELEDDASEHIEDDGEEGDSDHDTDVVEDEHEESDTLQSQSGDKEKPSLPCGTMKLTLTRHVSQITKESMYLLMHAYNHFDVIIF